jgi:hypothetical protein
MYGEIADGGFGPGGGLLPLAEAVDTYMALREDPPAPIGQAWPPALLPLIDYDPGVDGVDLDTGTVISWDPEELTERSGPAAWQRSFTQIAPSIETWLEDWVGSKTQEEQVQERMASTMVDEARKARARIAAMTPEERAAMGLPETGWEQVVWGGIGLEEDEGA